MSPSDTSTAQHISVLLHESIDSLNLDKGKTFLDGTLGAGGHSAAVAERFGAGVKIIGLDRDPKALQRSAERLRTLSATVELFQESFRNLDKVLGDTHVDAILLDLGVSSDQLSDADYGLSFMRDEPLTMSLSGGSEKGLSAKNILNSWDEDALELIIRGFGEEKFSRRIARQIVLQRESKEFETTFDLVEAVRAATPSVYHKGKLHPATRTFQALRIAVNEELSALEEGIDKGIRALASGGRFAIISFHSLEDRIVKHAFKHQADAGVVKLITKKPIVPSAEEVDSNPRSRSAKLRIIEKLS